MSIKQATLSIDKNTKIMAEKRAKEEQIPLSTIVKIFLRDYALGKLNIGSTITIRDENGFTIEKQKEILEILQETKENKNCSPSFSNADEALNWLKKNGN